MAAGQLWSVCRTITTDNLEKSPETWKAQGYENVSVSVQEVHHRHSREVTRDMHRQCIVKALRFHLHHVCFESIKRRSLFCLCGHRHFPNATLQYTCSSKGTPTPSTIAIPQLSTIQERGNYLSTVPTRALISRTTFSVRYSTVTHRYCQSLTDSRDGFGNAVQDVL